MTFAKRAQVAVVLMGAAGFVLARVLDPTVDQAARWLIYATSPAVTVFVVLYATTVPWWKTSIGRALLVSSAALMMLIDLSVAFQLFGADYLGRDAVRLTVLSLVFLGAWLKLYALLSEKWIGRRERKVARDE